MSQNARIHKGKAWRRKAVYSVTDLIELGFGSRQHLYNQLKSGGIPRVWVGKRCFIPGSWVHDRADLQDAL